jgi:hypothetical protein
VSSFVPDVSGDESSAGQEVMVTSLLPPALDAPSTFHLDGRVGPLIDGRKKTFQVEEDQRPGEDPR